MNAILQKKKKIFFFWQLTEGENWDIVIQGLSLKVLHKL